MMYESLKRKQLTSVVLQKELSENNFKDNPIAQRIGPETMDDLMANQQKISVATRNPQQECRHHSFGYQEVRNMNDGFVFQPRAPSNFVSPKVFIENAGQERFQLRKNQHF